MPGTWYRVACKNTEDACFGDLEAGTYQSQYIDPRLDVGAPWSAALGGITYTVPDGWSNSADWPNTFSLTPSASYATETADGPTPGKWHEILAFTQPFPAKPSATCNTGPDRTQPRTVAGLVASLRANPALEVTDAPDMTIDGYPATVVDLRVKDGWTSTCEGDQVPGTVTFVQAGDRQNDYGVGLWKGERQRLVLVDLGGGDVLGIVIDSGDPSRFEQLVAEATPIIKSFRFK
jgi:hypothetical protein